MSTLVDTIRALVPISAALQAALDATVQREELPARHVLLRPGQVA